jgi:hypothetical protein
LKIKIKFSVGILMLLMVGYMHSHTIVVKLLGVHTIVYNNNNNNNNNNALRDLYLVVRSVLDVTI